MVKDYLDQVRRLLDLKSSFSSRMLENDRIKKLEALEIWLKNSTSLEHNLQFELAELEDELKDLESRRSKLKAFFERE